MDRVAFTVPGRPKGKGRHRTDPRTGRAYADKKTVAAEREIAVAFIREKPFSPFAGRLLTGTVELNIEAVFAVPRSWSTKLRQAALAGEVEFTGKPDRDNIEKLVMDALNGVAWVDDCQVNRGEPVVRRYGEPERVEVTVGEVKATDGLKSPAERRREAKVASGMVPAKRRKPRRAGGSGASELLAIGRRLR